MPTVTLARPELIYVLAHNEYFAEKKAANPSLTLEQFHDEVKGKVGARLKAHADAQKAGQ